VKKDLCNENNDKYWFVENHYSVEAWFVPSPNKNSEDDGILVVPVLDGVRKESYLAIIDAVTMETSNKAVLPTYLSIHCHVLYHDALLVVLSSLGSPSTVLLLVHTMPLKNRP
jgi:carotenoid cleavage dioxygenase-like enzyme